MKLYSCFLPANVESESMRTPLYDRHVALGAKIVDFAGWEMPIQYKGILHEHRAVREKAGIFDVSHMARVAIKGKDASKFLEWLSTHKLKSNGSATYTCFCNEKGGTVDDAIVYKENEESLFVIFNASRCGADLKHFRDQAAKFDVNIEECFHTEGIIALQGPAAKRYFISVPIMKFMRQGDLIISGTGYTGSGGVEIFGPSEKIAALWDELIAKGVEPVGLGARDTLRLEKGYALYGHELSEEISPLESVSAWTVSLDKEFLGKDQLHLWKRKAYGVKLQGEAIPRQGYKVFSGEEEIGFVTSGGFSPSLKIPIALILAQKPLKEGDRVGIEIRGQKIPGVITSLPFV